MYHLLSKYNLLRVAYIHHCDVKPMSSSEAMCACKLNNRLSHKYIGMRLHVPTKDLAETSNLHA
jgi:hypothetical protein